jgi:hypothetical protein
MSKLIDEIAYDLRFIKSHAVQPQWWKVFKVFLILGVLAGYYVLFGLLRTVIFFATFMLLSTLVHLTYRAKTGKYRYSWLDFEVAEEGNANSARRIGKYYYSAIVANAILSLVVSQVLV